jgi:hypothetical protein
MQGISTSAESKEDGKQKKKKKKKKKKTLQKNFLRV